MRFPRIESCICLIFFIFISGSCGAQNSSSFTVGTVLFTPSDVSRECWSQENVALLTSRMLMSNLMPKTEKLKAEDDSFITDIIEYFRLLLEVIRMNTTGKTKHIMLMAATDTIGGYMKHLVLPITKYSYYAGNVQYGSIIRLYQLYDELKNFLRTNGNGWTKPWKKAGKHIQAKSISIQAPSMTLDPCKGLIYRKHCTIISHDTNEKVCNIDVPMPFFDSKAQPAAIAVPFRSFGLRNLESRVSSYILVKYFVGVSKCMAARNTLDEDVQKFNSGIFAFVASKVMPHLGDEKFYAAFGGVLRVLQTVSEISKAKGHAVGNINVMPEILDREPPDMAEDEEVAMNKKTSSDHHPKKNLIILLILFLVLMLLILCIMFVCCRFRARKMRHGKVHHDDENACMETTCPVLTEVQSSAMYSEDSDTRDTKTKIIYTSKQKKQPKPSQSKASKKSSKSSKSSKFSKSSKSTESHPTTGVDIDDDDTDSRSVLSRTTSQSMVAPYGQVLRVTSPQTKTTSGGMSPTEKESPPLIKLEAAPSPKKPATPVRDPSTQEMHSTTSTSTKVQTFQVHSMQQYYPPTFACHSSMTGKIKMNSSSDDFTSRDGAKRPYVFGYDFQTTSEGSSPRGDQSSDGENEMGGNMSK